MEPSSIQAWIIQAMFRGARRRAPRWSVVGLIGYGDAWSREISSRPPPEAIAEATVRARRPAIPDGNSGEMSKALSGPPAPGRNAGTTADPIVIATKTADRTRAR